MSKFSCNQERSVVLAELGFSSYKHYLASPAWDIIRRAVLFRDEATCRSYLVCPTGTLLQAHHLAYSRAALLGVNPSLIVTLCKEHHRHCEFNRDARRDAFGIRQQSLKLIANIRLEKGKSNRHVGRWFDNEFRRNQSTARLLLATFKSQLPEWYNLIIEQLRTGKLPEPFVDYLGLPARLPKKRYSKKLQPKEVSPAVKILLESQVRKPLSKGGVRK